MSTLDKLFSGMRASATGLASERVRLDVIAENIANARNTRSSSGGPYRRKIVHFEPILREYQNGLNGVEGVRAARVSEDFESPMTKIHDPAHPDADEDGFVQYPNVNAVLEMADMVTAMRSYQSNLSVQETFTRLAERALQLAR